MPDNAEQEKMAKLEELSYARQVYQNQYAMVTNSVQMAMHELQELDAALRTLESADMLKGKEALLGVGAGVYVRSVPSDPSVVLVAVGGSYVMEKSVDDAKAFVSSQKSAKTEILNKLAKSKRDLEAALIDIDYKIDTSGLQV